jgi:predicted metalloprotease
VDLSNVGVSGNVEDRRGMKAVGGMAAGGGGILILILGLVFGVDLNRLGLTGGGEGGPPPNDKYKEFAGKVVFTLEKVWEREFANSANGYRRSYEPPKLVLFSAGVQTGGCGYAPSEVGPFYCPGDKTMYLDPTFFDELASKMGGSKAEFSQAYVIAHENGHHVQNLLGYSARTDSKRGTRQENEYSIRLELQADYLAGVWAHHADKEFRILQGGDLESAIQTANSIGDDRIMKKAGRRPTPERYNHGTAEQRTAAFTQGFKTGDAKKATLDRFFDEAAARFNRNTGEIEGIFR